MCRWAPRRVRCRRARVGSATVSASAGLSILRCRTGWVETSSRHLDSGRSRCKGRAGGRPVRDGELRLGSISVRDIDKLYKGIVWPVDWGFISRLGGDIQERCCTSGKLRSTRETMEELSIYHCLWLDPMQAAPRLSTATSPSDRDPPRSRTAQTLTDLKLPVDWVSGQPRVQPADPVALRGRADRPAG